jgi:leucyl aminopeptidase
MEITSSIGDIFQSKSEAVVLFTYEFPAKYEERYVAALGENVVVARSRKEFEGKPKQLFMEKKAAVPRYHLLVGLGAQAKVTLATIRSAASTAFTALRGAGAASIAFELPDDTGLEPQAVAQALSEGIRLASYQFNLYKTQKLDEIKQVQSCVVFVGENLLAPAKIGIERGSILGNACNLVRDLQNLPSNDLTPKEFANRAVKVAKTDGVRSTVLEKDKLQKLGYGGIIGVGKGSVNGPCIVTLEYAPKNAKKTIAIVGKGLTFDSGGISIKPAKGMGEMKYDMSGAAVVVGATIAAAKLKVPVHIVGVLGLAENMPDGGSYKPGDVVKTKNGKTIEIDNTDAEGRVVLADALHHATLYRPDEIIDLATLTGAAIVALGDNAAPILGTNQELIDKLIAAGNDSGEKLWQLPLWDDYAEDIKSSIADMKNVGSNGMAGTIAGAMLLKEFAGDKPWAHLDIAGVANTQGRERWLTPNGGTAFGVRLLVEYMQKNN